LARLIPEILAAGPAILGAESGHSFIAVAYSENQARPGGALTTPSKFRRFRNESVGRGNVNQSAKPASVFPTVPERLSRATNLAQPSSAVWKAKCTVTVITSEIPPNASGGRERNILPPLVLPSLTKVQNVSASKRSLRTAGEERISISSEGMPFLSGGGTQGLRVSRKNCHSEGGLCLRNQLHASSASQVENCLVR